MPQKPLKEPEMAALFALFQAAKGSIHAPPPEHAVLARFRKDARGFARKALKDLARHAERYIVRHPTRGGMTYQITRAGIQKLREEGLVSS